MFVLSHELFNRGLQGDKQRSKGAGAYLAYIYVLHYRQQQLFVTIYYRPILIVFAVFFPQISLILVLLLQQSRALDPRGHIARKLFSPLPTTTRTPFIFYRETTSQLPSSLVDWRVIAPNHVTRLQQEFVHSLFSFSHNIYGKITTAGFQVTERINSTAVRSIAAFEGSTEPPGQSAFNQSLYFPPFRHVLGVVGTYFRDVSGQDENDY